MPGWTIQFTIFYPLRRALRQAWRGTPADRLDALADDILAHFSRCGFVIINSDKIEVPASEAHFAIRFTLEAHESDLVRRADDDTINTVAAAVVDHLMRCGFRVVKRRRPNTQQGGSHGQGYPEHWHPPPPFPRLPDWTVDNELSEAEERSDPPD
jgi:hypothetical protein